jgi:hypothetical protein
MASVVKYARTLAALLPGGQVWEKIKRHALWTGIAGEFARVEERVTDLSREMDPSQSTELLEDWERLVGLPDDTTPAGITLEERRASVVAKLSALGGLSRPYLEAIANKIQPGRRYSTSSLSGSVSRRPETAYTTRTASGESSRSATTWGNHSQNGRGHSILLSSIPALSPNLSGARCLNISLPMQPFSSKRSDQ